MKTKIIPFLSTPFTLICILFTLCSCNTVTRSTQQEVNSDDEFAYRVMKLIANSENEVAKKLLYLEMAKDKPVKAPFVKNGTLHYYAFNMVQTVSKLLNAAYFSMKIKEDSIRKNPGDLKELIELYDKTPWTSSVCIFPSYPRLYFLMGIILINERQYDNAIAYLDTCTYMWDGYAHAWSEKMYALISKGSYQKAKEIGKNALLNKDILFDSLGQAAILRKLGYIAIEEYELDKAEDYYNRSLIFEDSKTARQELEGIKELRKRKR